MGFLTIFYKYMIQQYFTVTAPHSVFSQYLKQIKHQMLVVVHQDLDYIRCSGSIKTTNQMRGAVKRCGRGAAPSKAPTPAPAPSFITSPCIVCS